MFDFQVRHKAESCSGTGGLFATRFEFDGGVADGEHIVGVGDDNEFVVGGREKAAIEQRDP